MPNLREIVAARAKVPAKIHAMEAGGQVAAPSSPSGALGGPTIVRYDAAQVVPGNGDAAPSSAPRPPRPPGISGSPSSGGGAPLRKVSESRKPRSGSEPGRRNLSEPRGRGGPASAGDADSEVASNGKPPVARAKARSSSVNASVPRARIGDAAPPVDKRNVGQVPHYLKVRNAEMAADKAAAARPHSPKAPAGYRKVPESEKQGTLDVLKARKSEVEKAQRNLPFKIETAGQKQREKELSDRLAHLDKLLGMFGQPVVFIPADAEPIANSVPPLPSGLAGRPTRERGDDGPGSEDGSLASKPRGRSGGGGVEEAMGGGARPASRDAGVRQNSRESRALAAAARRQECYPAPWDKAHVAPVGGLRTEVKVMAPPGGRSSLSLNWD